MAVPGLQFQPKPLLRHPGSGTSVREAAGRPPDGRVSPAGAPDSVQHRRDTCARPIETPAPGSSGIMKWSLLRALNLRQVVAFGDENDIFTDRVIEYHFYIESNLHEKRICNFKEKGFADKSINIVHFFIPLCSHFLNDSPSPTPSESPHTDCPQIYVSSPTLSHELTGLNLTGCSVSALESLTGTSI